MGLINRLRTRFAKSNDKPDINELFAMFQSGTESTVTPERVSQFVAEHKDAFEAFENAYQIYANRMTNEVIGGVSKAQADELSCGRPMPAGADALCAKIARDLTGLTRTITVDMNADEVVTYGWAGPVPVHEDGSLDIVTPEDVAAMDAAPEARPMLTSEAAVMDVNAESGHTLLEALINMEDASDERTRRQWYHLFRQGLDLLDLDEIVWAMLGQNPDSIENWLPALAEAVHESGCTLSIPRTQIAIVPETLLQMSRVDYGRVNDATKTIVDAWARDAFNVHEDNDLFIRTGTASSKFDFRNARVRGSELSNLGEYLLYLQHEQCQMASPTNNVCMYGMGTTRAWAVRDFIEPDEDLGHIYHGMPLRPEVRVFIDCDAGEVIGVSPYWRADAMARGLAARGDDPTSKHDLVVYLAHAEELAERMDKLAETASVEATKLAGALKLHGTWSVDIMQAEGKLWAIDMAQAARSALADVCDPARISAPQEHWLP